VPAPWRSPTSRGGSGWGGKLTIGVVTGDDLLGRLDGLLARGHALKNLDTGRPLRDVRDRVLSANAYLGAAPVVEALQRGAQVVITGRVTDTGLTLGPLMHAFGWAPDAWDRIAAGTVAGHIIECGAQCSGGNCLKDWKRIPDMANIGYPIVEARPDGTFDLIKHPATGGRIDVASVTEQLVYEMGDPGEYITPDGVADFTTIQLTQAGQDRVRVSGIKGKPATDKLKVSIAFFYGYKAIGTLVYAWPDALEKARADEKPVDRFTREIAPLILNGPPSVTGFAGGRPKPEEIVAYWPALIDKRMVQPAVELIQA